MNRRIFVFLTLILPLCLAVAWLLNSPFLQKKSAPSKHRILVIHKTGLAKKEMAKRIQLAATHMNCECAILNLASTAPIHRFFPKSRELFIRFFNPDIILSLQETPLPYKNAKQYVVLPYPSAYYFSKRSTYPLETLKQFDGFLISFPDKDKLSLYLSSLHKECSSIRWFSTCSENTFTAPRLFELSYTGYNMSSNSFGEKYRSLFSMLDRTDYFHIFGNQNEWLHTPNTYSGFIKNDGKSLLTTINEVGVSLVLHGPDHLYGKTPTARIFEAAAASSIIICDKHPFVIQEFGDSVLYINQELAPEKIFEEIDTHMRWIQSHPQEAIEMARKSHEIFTTKFTLEMEIQKLIAMHETLT